MKKTRMLTISSLMAAMCVVILGLGSLVESLDVSLSILAGLLVMILSTEYSDKVALAVFLVSGILSLTLPVKSPAVFFLALFGWYPVVQKKINMLKPILSRVVKTLLVNGVFVLLVLFSAFLTGTWEGKGVYLVLLILANFGFVLYDVLLDRFLIWYLLKLRNRLRF